MEFKYLYNDYSDGYIVEMKDGRTVLVNLGRGDILLGDPDLLYKFGMWTEIDSADESVTARITEILKIKL